MDDRHAALQAASTPSPDWRKTKIDALIQRLTKLPGARVGYGPHHPTAPNTASALRLGKFFESYPAVCRDVGYVEFQEKYAGAIVQDASETRIIDILGFGGAGTDMLEMDGPVVDQNGFLVFAQCMYYPNGGVLDMHEHDFAFSVAGKRPPGVYRCQSTLQTQNRGFQCYVDDFTAWLSDLLDHDGWYERPYMT